MFLFLVGIFVVVVLIAVFGLPRLKSGPRATDIFDQDRTTFETGVRRLPDGMLEVAAYTRMPNVTAEMVQWWFSEFLQTTEHYKMWEPQAHEWMEWENKRPGELVGASHLVHEYVGADLQKLRIQFVAPQDVFEDVPDLADGDVAICAWPGLLEEPLYIGKMCHFVKNTEFGCEMRSRFWLGDVAERDGSQRKRTLKALVGNTYLMRHLLVRRAGGVDLMAHAMSEMSNLADFLPDLYASSDQRRSTPLPDPAT